MNARNNYLMNTLVLVSLDTDADRKSGIRCILTDARFQLHPRLPTIFNRSPFFHLFIPVPFGVISTTLMKTRPVGVFLEYRVDLFYKRLYLI